MVPLPTNALSDSLIHWIREEGGDHAILLITIDGRLRPHIMMLARDEVALISPDHLRVAMGESTQSAVNLGLRSSATLAIYDVDLACVVKTHAMGPPRLLSPGTFCCDLAVEDVRFDSPTVDEGAARLVTGLRFEGRPERRDIRDLLKL